MTTRLKPTGASTKLTAAFAVEFVAACILLGAVTSQGPGPWSTGFSTWLSRRESIDAAAQIAGWVALTLLCWVMAVTVLHLIAALLERASRGAVTGTLLTRVATRFGPRWIASLAATATLVAVGATGCATAPPGPDTGPRSAAVDRAAVTMVVDPDPPGPVDTAPVGSAAFDSAPVTTAHPGADAVHSEPLPPAPPPAPAPRTVSVERGGSFWRIAEREVSSRLGRPATDAEIDPYWRVLIEVNRSRLVDPDDPDLLYPGQQLSLP